MIPVRNDTPPKTTRAPAQTKITPYIAGQPELALRQDLHQWRETVAPSLYGDYDLYGPDLLLHFKIIQRIVDLAHAHKLDNIQDLEIQTRWCFAHKYGEDIMCIVRRHFPKQIPPSPFVSTPLISRSRENQFPPTVSLPHPPSPTTVLAPRKPRAPPTCSVCRVMGHLSTSFLQLILAMIHLF